MALFGFGKKPKADPALDYFRDRIFPGGDQEKLFRGEKVVELANGKLLFGEALNVYTKAKLHFEVANLYFDGETHRGITAEELIRVTIESSGGKLTYFEAIAVDAYATFGRLDSTCNSFEALKGFLTGLFGSDVQGYDSNEIPFSVGEFGLTPTNPIPVRGITGIRVYLSKLRTDKGTKVVCKRVQAIKDSGQPGPTDEYYAFSEGGEFLSKIYISAYHQRISRKAPRGFRVEPGAPIT